eukprot:PhM_4_TR5346/c0_g1_i1/m.32608
MGQAYTTATSCAVCVRRAVEGENTADNDPTLFDDDEDPNHHYFHPDGTTRFATEAEALAAEALAAERRCKREQHRVTRLGRGPRDTTLSGTHHHHHHHHNATSYLPPLPHRCCLPQVDPSPNTRHNELNDAIMSMPILKGTMARSGLPFDFPTPTWERRFATARARVRLSTRVKLNLHVSAPHMMLPSNRQPDDFLFDDAFAEARLRGPHANVIRLVLKREHIPPYCEISDDDLLGLMGPHDTLASAIAAQRIYMVDHGKTLEKAKPKAGCMICNPIALFYLSDGEDGEKSKKLRPIAIQLYCIGNNHHNNKSTVHTPSDSFWPWHCAKLLFNHADLQVHLAKSFLLETIMVPCVFNIIMQRTLSFSHPVRQLMTRYLHLTIPFLHSFLDLIESIFDTQQLLSIDTKTFLEAITSEVWNSKGGYTFNNKSFWNDCVERMDVADVTELPFDYPYMKQGKQYWDIINQHVRAFLEHYYTNTDAVTEDTELQNFFRELSDNIPRVTELNVARALDPIVFNLSTIIFAVTYQFTALTAPMVPFYMHTEAFPAMVHKTAMTAIATTTTSGECFSRLLPSQRHASLQCATFRVLSNCLSKQTKSWNLLTFGNVFTVSAPLCSDPIAATNAVQALRKMIAKQLKREQEEKEERKDMSAVFSSSSILHGFGHLMFRDFDSASFKEETLECYTEKTQSSSAPKRMPFSRSLGSMDSRMVRGHLGAAAEG